MSSRRLAKISLSVAIAMLVVAVAGFITTLILNAFYFDEYDAYGEVPIPGSGTVHLPAGGATVSLHALVIGGADGGLPVPPLQISVTPPEGVPQPEVTESIGGTTTVNNDAHVRVWNVQVPVEGDYHIKTDGQVGGYINPQLAFGHTSSYGWLVWVFVGLFVVALVDLALSILWLARSPARVVSVSASPYVHDLSPSTAAVAYEPTDDGVRLERLKTLAGLRDSGALTEEEFESEKRRILQGH
ncbi:SHOCT domain-containing protein [Mycobacterium kubicae]|uniref:SHOCT domain-containing protein n=1 Tax=Mycobacterium kubicae TaxID=120959 RepID=UPI0007FB9CD4|nr:SHOCT domain-containing protein [Mycobacterium kubicae]OBF21398.1 hypothetical protein A5725_01305 [Mycobacterium kubicae]OBK49803.1 hypothetical protein A5657_21275 [Mycobacterium kubicae]